jgi:hypothetical protein
MGNGLAGVNYDWQPQLAEAASPQHDAFSEGSQQLACLVGEQQLAGSAAGRGSLLLVGDNAAIDRPDTDCFMVILLLVEFPAFWVER